MKFSKLLLTAALVCTTLSAISAPADVRKYERAGVYNPDLGKNVDLHYDFTEAADALGFKVVEQHLMDACVQGFVKVEKIPDPDANLYKVLPGFGCEAYGIGFTLDNKKGWLLSPSKTSGKYPTGAFLLKWASDNNKKPAFVLME